MSTELKGTESINGEVMLTRYFGDTEHNHAIDQVIYNIKSHFGVE